MNSCKVGAACFQKTLEEALRRASVELPLLVFDELDSTNRYAKDLARENPNARALVVALSQTAGRGRMGRSFYSPANSGVYFSLLLPLSVFPDQALSVTSRTAVAVRRAICSLTGKSPEIKWVNDLYLDGKKICGILAESVLSSDGASLILGIGVNWYAAAFPTELSSIAGSVDAGEIPREDLIACICRELLPLLEDATDRSWLCEYREHSLVLGKPVTWLSGEIERRGVALDIDEMGGLLVESEGGERHLLRTGEISLRLSKTE